MKNDKKQLLIIDGNALIHRSFHALPVTMATKTGLITNAVYGFTAFLLKALLEFKPAYIVLTLDRKAPTFRHEEYKEYKATRVKAPDELYAQIPLVKEVATVLNIPIYELDGFEADDLIGTITRQVDGEVEKIIITGDMDTLQLINDDTKVFTMSRGLNDSALYDAKAVIDRYGLKPEQMVDYKGLRGDPSDNIPGVKGIGEKTASELLADFKTLEKLYLAVDKNDKRIKPRILELLKDQRDQAYLSKKLATIDCAAPIKFSLVEAEFKNLDLEKIRPVFDKLEFKSLLPRISALDIYLNKKNSSATPTKNTGTDKIDSEINPELQVEDKFARDLKNFKYHLIDTDKDFEAFLKKLEVQEIFAFDTETTGLNPLLSDLLGMSFAWKDGEAYFLNLGTYKNRATSTNLFSSQKPSNDRQAWLKKLQPIFTNPKIKKCAHNLKFDYRMLTNQGLEINGVYFDSMIASYLLNPEGRQNSLDALSFSELNFSKISRAELLGDKNKFDYTQAPLDKLYVYAAEDADFTWRLVKVLEKRLKTEKLWNLFQNIEMPLIPVLAKMEDTGILIDKKILSNMDKELSATVIELEKKIFTEAGVEFNVASPKQLKEILFDKLQISSGGIKKTKTGLSTAADELEKMKDAHPIIPLIQEHRELSKLLSTYIKALPEIANQNDGRIHTSFNQTIAATGRLSSTDPNLQNIPTKTPLGQKIRTAFVADAGNELLSLDYSQIELRIVAHLAQDKKMMTAFKNNEDIHTATAAAINNVALDKVTKAMRQSAKAINFGIIYGQGAHGLAQTSGLSFYEAREFIEKYFTIYTGVRKFLDQTIATAHKDQFVETISGRRRPLADINSPIMVLQKAAERMAVNTPIQGTAADMIKKAMIEVAEFIKDKSDIKMLLQVHDELIFEVKIGESKKYIPELKKIMANVLKLDVPIIADANIGSNWGALK